MKTTLVIFGITGDLSTRKLLPALEQIINTGDFDDLSIVGVSRRQVQLDELFDPPANRKVIDRTTIFTMDLERASEYLRLKDHLAQTENEQIVMYLAVPPSSATQIVELLGEAGLNGPHTKLLFEKPFGFDLVSAQDFIERTAQFFLEDQIYRIDHYMAKEVSQEIIRLRSNAENHHHSWGKQSIRSVEIVASEKIGIENRVTFYEQTGALRDFIQGHLMQLLSLVLMNIPNDFDIKNLSSYRLAALEQITPADPNEAIRAQYDSYQNEVGGNGSVVETFVSIMLHSDDESWQNVPLRLTTGKSLDEKRTYVTISYTDGTQDSFEEEHLVSGDRRLPDAYERVLVEAINGRKSIFTSSLEIIRSWEILQPLQRAWEQDDSRLVIYTTGSHWLDISESSVE